jgi:hypothetical protein
MKFVLFCEGWTEKSALPDFLRRSLSGLKERVGIQPVRFDGWAELVKDSPVKAGLHLQNPDVIAVIALLDLYGPTFYQSHHTSVDDRLQWAKSYLEGRVKDCRFRQHFAVHDIEAWILSQPDLLPASVRKKLPPRAANPETINFNEPPGDLLNRLYRDTTGRNYKKLTYGEELFRKLDPAAVREKCPHFCALADDLIALAEKAIESMARQ